MFKFFILKNPFKETVQLESLVNYLYFKVYAQIQFLPLLPFWIDASSERASTIPDFMGFL